MLTVDHWVSFGACDWSFGKADEEGYGMFAFHRLQKMDERNEQELEWRRRRRRRRKRKNIEGRKEDKRKELVLGRKKGRWIQKEKRSQGKKVIGGERKRKRRRGCPEGMLMKERCKQGEE